MAPTLFRLCCGIVVIILHMVIAQEPSCYTTNRFEYEFQVLQKLDSLEKETATLREKHSALLVQVEAIGFENKANKAVIDALQTAVERYKRMKDPGGSTYVRWGRTSCPSTSELVYDGYAGGGSHVHTGAGANYLCLPKDPQWAPDTTPSYRGYVHGAEYQTHGTFLDGMKDHEVPCAVCKTNSSNVLMVPARQECHEGWVREYHGFLMAEREIHVSSKGYVCMDGEPEFIPGTHANLDGALFHFQEAVCGSLPCLPYIGGRELTCVVCTLVA